MTKCVVNLLANVDIGHVFVISGVLSEDCKGFKITFSSNGDKVYSEIPLAIAANVVEKSVTLTTIVNNELKTGEVFNVKAIGDDSMFKFYILVLDDKFRIAMDDEHLCSFKYQSDLININMVKISGDIECVKQVDHRRVYPFSWPNTQEDLPSCAFSCDVPCLFSQNTIIVLRMTLLGDDQNGSFFIRFNERASKKQLFHFNPRFRDKQIIINNMNDNLE